MPRVAEPIRLEVSERLELQRWVVAHTTPQQVTQRCRIILAAADGCGDKDIAEKLEVNFKTVALWRSRFGIWRLLLLRWAEGQLHGGQLHSAQRRPRHGRRADRDRIALPCLMERRHR